VEPPVQAAEQPKVFANSEHPTLPRLHHKIGSSRVQKSLNLLLAYVGWVANYENNRRSERAKAAKTQGSQSGQPTGSKDQKKRKGSVYFARELLHFWR